MHLHPGGKVGLFGSRAPAWFCERILGLNGRICVNRRIRGEVLAILEEENLLKSEKLLF
jgi:hypothetical protein